MAEGVETPRRWTLVYEPSTPTTVGMWLIESADARQAGEAGERVEVVEASELDRVRAENEQMREALTEIEFGTEALCVWCWTHGHTATERAEHLPTCPVGGALGGETE